VVHELTLGYRTGTKKAAQRGGLCVAAAEISVDLSCGALFFRKVMSTWL
jgi:hypothetical protein